MSERQREVGEQVLFNAPDRSALRNIAQRYGVSMRTIERDLAHVKELCLSQLQADKIGMNGYCFGGGVVWRCTEQIPELKAAAPFYGAVPPPEKWDQIKAAVLGVYSSDPNDFANARRDELDEALTAAGATHKFNVYPGTMHAFHNDTAAAYNQQQALAAWADMIAWFKQYLVP